MVPRSMGEGGPDTRGICPAHAQEPHPPFRSRNRQKIKVLSTDPVSEGVYPASGFQYRMCNYSQKKSLPNSFKIMKPLILLGF